ERPDGALRRHPWLCAGNWPRHPRCACGGPPARGKRARILSGHPPVRGYELRHSAPRATGEEVDAMSHQNALLSVEGLTVRFEGVTALADVSFAVPQGELFAV